MLDRGKVEIYVGNGGRTNGRKTAMLEEEWLACSQLKTMIRCLTGRVSERKNRLFNVACCRRIWHLFAKPAVQEAILVGQRFAEGQADKGQLREALRVIHKERSRMPTGTAAAAALEAAGFTAAELHVPLQAVSQAIQAAVRSAAPEPTEEWAVRVELERAYCDLARDFFRQVLYPIEVDPGWLVPNVTNLAAVICTERSFEDMPVLADALEEAGCTHPVILAHCRDGKVHDCGCWLLDRLLGKE